MKANELRIGNLVFAPKETPDAIVIDNYNYPINNDRDYYPIPLTKEWLWKLGVLFETQTVDIIAPYLSLRDDEHMWIEFDADGHYNLFLKQKNTDGTVDTILLDIELQSVHQLQNLYFALTGEELILNTVQVV